MKELALQRNKYSTKDRPGDNKGEAILLYRMALWIKYGTMSTLSYFELSIIITIVLVTSKIRIKFSHIARIHFRI